MSDEPMNPGDQAPPGTPSTGEDVCPKCDGTGALATDQPCENCGGSGRIVVVINGA